MEPQNQCPRKKLGQHYLKQLKVVEIRRRSKLGGLPLSKHIFAPTDAEKLALPLGLGRF